MIDWRDDEERWIDRRSQYLKRAAPLNDTQAEIIAWSELGYSSSGIAKKAELGETTVRSHLDEIAERFGASATWARRADKIDLEAPLGGEQ